MPHSRPTTPVVSLLLLSVSLGAVGCDSGVQDAPESTFSLRFAAVVDGQAVGCTSDLGAFGPAGTSHLGLNDLRFYVSSLALLDTRGQPVTTTLDENEFQYASADGTVTLIDLTGNAEGTCAATSIAAAEGTGRVHAALTGITRVQKVASVSFDVGIPQPLMKATIAAHTPEGAPSPLNEMYWNWNSGYRHFVLNLAIDDGANGKGAGYVHVGSRDCAPSDDAIKALSDRDACTFVNTPKAALSTFDLAADFVGIDLRALLHGPDFVAPVYDPATFDVIGQGPGVECHSSPTQPDCAPIFTSLGVDLATGMASPTTNKVFVKMR